MTRRVHVPRAVLLCVCSASLSAAVSDVPNAAKESTIRSLEEQERTAVLREDVHALERLWSEQLIVNTPQSDISADRSVVLSRIEHGLIRYSQFDRVIEAVRFVDNIAIVMGSETIVRRAETADTPKPVRRRVTNIWRQSAEGWRMIARHANVIPGP